MKIQRHSEEAIAAAMQVLREHFMYLAKNSNTMYIPGIVYGDDRFKATFHACTARAAKESGRGDDSGRFLAFLEIKDEHPELW